MLNQIVIAADRQPTVTPNVSDDSCTESSRTDPTENGAGPRMLVISTGLRLGGAELMLLRLVKALRARNYIIRVVSLVSRGELIDDFLSVGVPVRALELNEGYWKGLRSLVELWSEIRSFSPDVTQTWMYHADVLGGVFTRLCSRSPCIWGLRNSTLDRKDSRWRTRLIVKMAARLSRTVPDSIVSCSERAIDIHRAVGYDHKKMIFIPNGFDSELFRPDEGARNSVRDELSIPLNVPLIGVFGRFDPQKNHRGFLEVARAIRGQCPTAHFLMVGADVDPTNPAFEGALIEPALKGHLHLLGQRRDVPRLLAALDALAMPSLYGEAFPNVVAEAMLSGVPVVAFDVGDVAAIVQDHGTVVPCGDIAAMASRLLEVVDRDREEPRYSPDNVRASISKRFALETTVGQYVECYERRIAQNAGELFIGLHAQNFRQRVKFAVRPLSYVGTASGYFFKIPYRCNGLFDDARSGKARFAAEQEYRQLHFLRSLHDSVVQPIEVTNSLGCVVMKSYQGSNLRDVLLESRRGADVQRYLDQAMTLLAQLHVMATSERLQSEALIPPIASAPGAGCIVIDGFEIRNLMISDSGKIMFFDPHHISWGERENDITRFIISVLMASWSRTRPGGVFRQFSLSRLLQRYTLDAKVEIDWSKMRHHFEANLAMRLGHASVALQRMGVVPRVLGKLYQDWFFEGLRIWGQKNGF